MTKFRIFFKWYREDFCESC